MTPAEYVTALLTEHHWRRAWLAEASGLSRTMISDIANGREMPGARACALIGAGAHKLKDSIDPTRVAGTLCMLAAGVDIPRQPE